MAIITISRGTYSGGMELARCLGEALKYRLLSREELLASAAEKYGASESQLDSALRHRPGFLERGRLTKLHYVYCVQAALAKEALTDNVVYHGYAGHLLLSGISHQLRLKVVADMDYRIRAAMQRGNMDAEAAARQIAELDRARDQWVDWVYGADRNDPTTYDMVINIERIPVDSVCAIVTDTVDRDFPTSPQSQVELEDLACASDLQARISLDPEIDCDRVDISMRGGIVTIAGTVSTLQDADKIRRMVREEPGVEDIVSKMATRWS